MRMVPFVKDLDDEERQYQKGIDEHTEKPPLLGPRESMKITHV
jgi:hypothetical protein